jgi:uncharacterized damage-inducible protein DinB
MQQGQPAESRAQRLETMIGEVIEQVEGLSAETLYREPGPDDWSVTMTLVHLAEVLPYWSRQVQDVVGRERDDQPFGRTHDDPDRIAAVERHAHDRIDEVLPRLRDGLAETTALLRNLPATAWARTARHARRGTLTVEEIVDQFLVDHTEEHLTQIRNLLAANRS